MEISNIKYVSDTILNSLDILVNSDCQSGKYSLSKIKELSKNTDILFLLEKGKPIYFLLLDLFTKHKTIYIHDVCLSKLHRGKGLFKKSLLLLKKYYSGKGYTSFTLDASYSTKEEGLDQRARIHIFHSAGFYINPESGYFTTSGDYNIIKTIVLLNNKEIVEIQKRDGDKYYVKNNKDQLRIVDINQIEKCFDSELNQIECPMIMNISSSGGKKNITRRIKKKSS
jgi:hypothetical protein